MEMQATQPLARAPKGELQTNASTQMARSLVECAYIIALKRPRSTQQARQTILDHCKRHSFAEKALYTRPVSKTEDITGPSIRLAEICLQAWGNMRVESTTIHEDDSMRMLKIGVIDLETNCTVTKDVTVEKTIERKWTPKGANVLGERQNTKGEKLYILEATPSDMTMKQNREESRVIRNAVLRLIPEDIIQDAVSQVEETLQADLEKNKEEQLKRVIDGFAELGVKVKELESYLGHELTGIQVKELLELRKIYTTIKEGEASWRDFAVTRESSVSFNLDKDLSDKDPDPKPKPKRTRKPRATASKPDPQPTASKPEPAPPKDPEKPKEKKRGRPRAADKDKAKMEVIKEEGVTTKTEPLIPDATPAIKTFKHSQNPIFIEMVQKWSWDQLLEEYGRVTGGVPPPDWQSGDIADAILERTRGEKGDLANFNEAVEESVPPSDGTGECPPLNSKEFQNLGYEEKRKALCLEIEQLPLEVLRRRGEECASTLDFEQQGAVLKQMGAEKWKEWAPDADEAGFRQFLTLAAEVKEE